MRKSTRRKLKVYAVDAAMILLAAQVTVVLKADNKAEASTYTIIQAIQDEQAETGSDAETPENDTKYNSASEDGAFQRKCGWWLLHRFCLLYCRNPQGKKNTEYLPEEFRKELIGQLLR